MELFIVEFPMEIYNTEVAVKWRSLLQGSYHPTIV
jgi:hypothetical protein